MGSDYITIPTSNFSGGWAGKNQNCKPPLGASPPENQTLASDQVLGSITLGHSKIIGKRMVSEGMFEVEEKIAGYS